MAASLTPRFKLIALDLRGRGLSEKPPGGYSVGQHFGQYNMIATPINATSAPIISNLSGTMPSIFQRLLIIGNLSSV
jgi:hypothetical protein